ncbi:MAG: hydroxylamine reductase [Bacteroidales bacterium]
MEKMFCFQCQEASKGVGCSIVGVCGKSDELSAHMDLLIYVAKGISILSNKLIAKGFHHEKVDHFVMEALFSTITNANFDVDSIAERIEKGIEIKNELIEECVRRDITIPAHTSIKWSASRAMFLMQSAKVGILTSEPNEDLRSLKELVMYGVKGMAAYVDHAYNLGYKKQELFDFMHNALATVALGEAGADELVALVLKTGEMGVNAMALLDKAHTETYGNPEITTVNIGVGKRPGILISGHDLKDMEELLKQSEGSGVDIYTHSEMLPAHYYPAFKKYSHFVGNYGGSWWRQKEEFSTFNGPIIFTTNCIVPPSANANYKDRVFTTGSAGYPGFKHIPARKGSNAKDFSEIIALAKGCEAPKEIESGTIVGGFAHNQVMALADKVVDAVKSGAIKQFVVMGGCDGRMKDRVYYEDFAKELPQDSVILTAGCAKYRYNKLPLGDIGGIPRVLDAGQCNDSYSLAVIALKLKDAFGLEDINDLPIVYNIAWYEQKAVIVLLALLSLGVKKIHLGPTLPAFLSPNVTKVLVEKFEIGGISTVSEDMKAWGIV